MGLRGPAPKPEGARLRRNGDYAPVTKIEGGEGSNVAPYEADENWHKQAIALYEAYQNSPQSELFVESDWVKVYVMCEALSRELKPQFIGFAEAVQVFEENGVERHEIVKKPVQGTVPLKGATLNALNSWMTSLLTTEADRRRLSIEISKANAEPEKSAGDKAMDNVYDLLKRGGKKDGTAS